MKLKKKHTGNVKLMKAVDTLIDDFKKARWKNKEEVLSDRKDGDCVHNDGFYFFDINIHRTFVLVEYQPADAEKDANGIAKDEGRISVLWVGSHEDYERIFKNNKSTIETWLRNNSHID